MPWRDSMAVDCIALSRQSPERVSKTGLVSGHDFKAFSEMV
jgi:hypothetical protein